MKLKTTKDPVRDYADNVLSGKIPASRWVKLACRRHRDDLKRKDIVWDLDEALFALGFFRDVLCLNGGQYEGKPFVLDAFQVFIVGSIFGWKLLDGRRRFNNAYIEMAKGSGKSPLAAGIGHLGLVADGEARAEIYAAATKKDQAMVMFRDAVAMYNLSPSLKAQLRPSGVGERCWNLADHTTASFFRPISSDEDSQSGPRPHFALIDEIHEHKTDIVIVMLNKGFKFRRNPLMFMITNSGTDRESVCWRYHDLITRILRGTAIDDRFFGFIACLDSCEEHWTQGQEQPVDGCPHCDDWRREGPHWRKANPLLGESMTGPPGIDYIRREVQRAANIPAEENSVRRLNFGFWTQQVTRWLSIEAWDGCSRPIDYAYLNGRTCILGLDLAISRDLAALVAIFPPDRLALAPIEPTEGVDPDGERPPEYARIDMAATDDFVVLPFFFCPKDSILKAERNDGVPYTAWERAGLLTATEGPTIDYVAIRQKILALNQIYPIRTEQQQNQIYHLIGYDQFNAQQFSADMADRFSINMIQVKQGYWLNEPTKQMAELVVAGKLRHGGHPVLRWMASNMVVRTSPEGNVKPDKDKAKKKIDGIVAMIMAFSLAIRFGGGGINVYEERWRKGGDESVVRSV